MFWKYWLPKIVLLFVVGLVVGLVAEHVGLAFEAGLMITTIINTFLMLYFFIIYVEEG